MYVCVCVYYHFVQVCVMSSVYSVVVCTIIIAAEICRHTYTQS